MSKKLQFTVTLEFADSIVDDNDVMEIAKNIARAIRHEADNGRGIVTDYSDTYTKKVTVKPQFVEGEAVEIISEV